jgi:hypothetical protein
MERDKLPGLKAQAKQCMKAEEFTAAFLHLSHALK